MKILTERLKKLRVERGLTQEMIARKLDMILRTYCRYETGESEPQISVLARIADFYGVSLDYLAGRTDRREFEPGADRREMQAQEVDGKSPQ